MDKGPSCVFSKSLNLKQRELDPILELVMSSDPEESKKQKARVKECLARWVGTLLTDEGKRDKGETERKRRQDKVNRLRRKTRPRCTGIERSSGIVWTGKKKKKKKKKKEETRQKEKKRKKLRNVSQKAVFKNVLLGPNGCFFGKTYCVSTDMLKTLLWGSVLEGAVCSWLRHVGLELQNKPEMN